MAKVLFNAHGLNYEVSGIKKLTTNWDELTITEFVSVRISLLS
jgi:hypothetical protein